MAPEPGTIRIGELSRRVGVSRELLRAWERRYGLFEPARSTGDYRLYSDADEARARAMQRHLARGLSAAQAAEAVHLGTGAAKRLPTDLAGARTTLQTALEQFDDARAHALLDTLLATFGADTVLGEVVIPVLCSLGEAWAAGEVTVAQEHFASNVLRGRMLGLARGSGRGSGPLAVLACPPGELHDMGLLVFGIALHEAGWRMAFLGADTPIAAIASTAELLDARAIVLSAVDGERLHAAALELSSLADGPLPIAIGGMGADIALAGEIGATLLSSDPIAAATELAHAVAR